MFLIQFSVILFGSDLSEGKTVNRLSLCFDLILPNIYGDGGSVGNSSPKVKASTLQILT